MKEPHLISNLDPTETLSFKVADERTVSTEGAGTFGPLKKVHACPKFGQNLLSVPQLHQDNKAVLFSPTQGILIIDDSVKGAIKIQDRAKLLYLLAFR